MGGVGRHGWRGVRGMKKDEMLTRWANVQNAPLCPRPVPYKHRGSTYDCDGIRITGQPEFIDAVLYKLRDLLRFEGIETRLQVSYAPATDRETRAPLGSFSCYVQVHQRGGEGAMMQAFIAGARERTAAREALLPGVAA